jgi:hypothetical protein
VQIRCTQYGVPYIQGETLEAAAFDSATLAEDHLINVMAEFWKRGTLSQSLGPARTISSSNDFSRQYRIHHALY